MPNATKVIDAHAHLGECCVFGLNSTEEELVRRMDENGIDATIVQPYPGAKDSARTHDRIAELCAKYPGRFFGLASLSPHGDHHGYWREIERCIRELHFVGLKLHTIGHAVNPLSEDGDFLFATAHDLGIPAMVHTGPGIPFALPSLCIPAAQKYPGLKIILAHAGFAVFSAEAQVAASVCGNLYLETSWCIGEDIRWMISTIGPERVMLGSDLPSNVPVEIAKYKALDLDPAVYVKVIGKLPAKCSTFIREATMFVLHVDLQGKPGSRSELQKAFVESFRPAISAQEGFAGVELLQSMENEIEYRLVIIFASQALQQKWVATDIHQRVWPQIEQHCVRYSVRYYDTSTS